MIICEKLIRDQCVVASDIAGMEVPTTPDACKYCLNCESPKSLNKATASMAVTALIKKGSFDKRNSSHEELKNLLTVEIPTSGPGTELKKLISWFPVPGKSKCRSCKNLELKMNRWGPATCESKIAYIVKKLQIAAKRRSIPFSESLAKTLIRRAIRNAK